ncbi:MAG: hypothetical protein AAB783_00950 [Patescibacteria group bacterium]
MRKILIEATALLFPIFVYAATIEDVFDTTTDILGRIVVTLIVLGTVVFLWGIVRYVTAGGDEKRLEEARKLIIFGIIGLTVMVSMWGIVKLITTTFDIGSDPIPTID